MDIISKLATSLNRRDEVPNQELAQEISEANDTKAVKELIENLRNKDKNIQSDCIKVLYEIGERKPSLVASHQQVFVDLLKSKNNRLVWGAMSVLDAITSSNASSIYNSLPSILDAMEKGSVITNDRGVNILIKLASQKAYAEDAIPLLLSHFKTCPANQLPMYAENAVPVISDKFRKEFINVLTSRLADMEKESKRKRVEKVIKKLG